MEERQARPGTRRVKNLQRGLYGEEDILGSPIKGRSESVLSDRQKKVRETFLTLGRPRATEDVEDEAFWGEKGGIERTTPSPGRRTKKKKESKERSLVSFKRSLELELNRKGKVF